MNQQPNLKKQPTINHTTDHITGKPMNDNPVMSVNPTPNHLSHQSVAQHSSYGTDLSDLIKLNHLTYFLYVLSYFTAGLLWVVPIIINYLKRDKASGTWLATHFDWQIKTFWYGLIYGVVAIVVMLLSFVGGFATIFTENVNIGVGSGLLFIVGFLLLVFAVLWHLYRIIRGWVALSNNQPVP